MTYNLQLKHPDGTIADIQPYDSLAEANYAAALNTDYWIVAIQEAS